MGDAAQREPGLVGAGASGAQRWGGGADAGVPAPAALWAEPRFVSLTLGVTIVLSLRTRQSTGCFTRDHHPGVWSGG